MSIIEYVGSLGGIAGVMVVLIFYAYRYLVKQMREDRRFMEDRLTEIIKDYNEACRYHAEAMTKHSAMIAELMTWLKARNGHS